MVSENLIGMTHLSNDADGLATLMRSAQDGDASAYARLLGLVAPIIRRMARRHWTGIEEAEDVVQEVLLSIHAVRHTYDPARPFIPWLMAIARHRLADIQRRQMRWSKNEVAVDALPATFLESKPNDPIDALAKSDELRRAIAGLPAGQQRAVQMLKLEEMSLREASAASGMSVASLKVSTHRAMKALRAALSK